MRLTPALVAVALAGAVVPAATPALSAERGEACAAAAVAAQDLRDAGKLRAARAQLVLCSAEACPNPMRTDCRKWLAEVDDATPTMVVRARDSRGSDVFGASATLDGAPLLDGLTGLAVAVDPGPHRLRLVARDGHEAEVEVVVAQGDKGRQVTVDLPAPLTPDGQAAPGIAAPPGPPPSGRGPSRWPSIVAAGVGAVAMGLAIGFEIAGQSEYDGLKAGCGATGSCSTGQVGSVHDKLYVIAPAAFAVGLVGLGAAGALFLWTGGGGSAVGVAGRF